MAEETGWKKYRLIPGIKCDECNKVHKRGAYKIETANICPDCFTGYLQKSAQAKWNVSKSLSAGPEMPDKKPQNKVTIDKSIPQPAIENEPGEKPEQPLIIPEELHLTEKQKRFCDEYLIDFNATRAAIAAGYSKKTAHASGRENLQKPAIQKYLNQRKKAITERNDVTLDEVVGEFVKIMRADMKNFVDITEDSVRFKPADEIDGTLIQEISASETQFGETTKRDIKFKLQPKIKALDALAKYFKMYSDQPINNNNVYINGENELKD